MKKLLGIIVVAILGTTAITSCNKADDNDYQKQLEEAIQNDKKLDSLFSAEALEIQKYMRDNSETFLNPQEDTVTVRFQYIEKTIKRGIWYSIEETGIEDSYEYKGQLVNSIYGTYFAPILPKVKLQYTAKLLNGTTVQSDVTGSSYNLSEMAQQANPNIYNNAWRLSFIPYIIKYNGTDEIVGGLTAKGLKKGSKIKVITPSYWAFGTRKVGDIPANSPLVYEFTVLEIE